MSFASLKKQSNLGSLTAKLVKEVEKVNNSSGGGDERLWKPELDKTGNGYAVIRFLPAPDKEEIPWAKLYTHAFQGPGGWYIENSLTTNGQKDPVSDHNRELWNSGNEADKDTVRKQKRKLSYYSNIYVVKDPTNPQNEGKVFLFKYGKKIFDKVKNKDSTFQIMGSYRRGDKNSGDIDICISDSNDDSGVFNKFIDALIEKGILIEVLSRGNTKSLGVSKLRRKPARRIDFMFTKHNELAFALLYFTGSKEFNTVMRKRALDMGYSMNEHGLYKMVDGKKGTKLDRYFPTEKSVFDFMGMVYKGPTERKDGNSVVLIVDNSKKTFWQETYPEQKKKKKKIDKSKVKKFIFKDAGVIITIFRSVFIPSAIAILPQVLPDPSPCNNNKPL